MEHQVKLQPNLYDPELESMNFLNEVVLQYPQAVSFAPGRPVESLFDVEAELAEIERFIPYYQEVTGKDRQQTFNALGQYGKTNGIIADLVAQHLLKDEGIEVPAEAIAITAGCQEAMMMLLMALFEPGRDVLLVGDPSYVGITGAARILGIELMPVALDNGEVPPEQLIQALEAVRKKGKRARALYLIPDFNNPLGGSMSRANRKQILALAESEDLLLFEDNPYGMFVYDGEPTPTLKSMDSGQRVVYLGTFAKTLFPGLRIGYVVADQRVGEGRLLAHELSKVKSFLTVNTSPVLQAVTGGILLGQKGSLRSLIAPKVAFYKQNRDTMVACLTEAFGPQTEPDNTVGWNIPKGGFFLTVTLPFPFTRQDVHILAKTHGVIVCPMSLFYLTPSDDRRIRLSFSYVDPAQIRRGVTGLARYLKSRRPKSPTP